MPDGRGCLGWLLGGGLLLGLTGALLFFLFANGDDPDGGQAGPPGAAPSPTATAPAEPTPVVAPEPAGFDLPEQAGGLDLTFSGGPEARARQDAMERAGIAVTELVGGRYEGGDVLIDFHGGGLAEPLTPAQVDESGRELLETTFAASFPNLTPGQSTGYDPGPRGGEVWCTAYDDTASHACGWVDERTIGFVFRTGTAEADTAALLRDMREDIQAD
jgi:hypothetical protein